MSHESQQDQRATRRGVLLGVGIAGIGGVLAIVAALLVRVSWPNPVMTALGAVLALALGVSGVFYLLFACWLLATGRVTRRAARA